MTALKWWLRIVGSLYLMEGLGLTAAALLAPAEYAAVWASTPAAALDSVAVRGILLAGLPGTLTWVLFGALLWGYSRATARAGMLVAVVALWELLVWVPTDILSIFNGFKPGRAATLVAIHVATGASGLALLRRAQGAATSPATA